MDWDTVLPKTINIEIPSLQPFEGMQSTQFNTLVQNSGREHLSRIPAGIKVQNTLKRGLDITGSFVCIIASMPIWVVVAVAVKLNSKGPLFFVQERMGHHEKPFKILKFRTMMHHGDAEDHKNYIKKLLQEDDRSPSEREALLSQYFEYVQGKVTSVGRFLRASSLDELPQLINIFIGQMSLVGPRPHPLYEVKEYKGWYHRRHEVKPGLTGWSKINLRLTPKNYEKAIHYDLWYVDHWNVAVDIKILLKTIPFILFNRDAQ